MQHTNNFFYNDNGSNMLWSTTLYSITSEKMVTFKYNRRTQNKRSQKEPSYREEDNIKMNFRRLGFESRNWIGLRMVSKGSLSWTVWPTYEFHTVKTLDQHSNYQLFKEDCVRFVVNWTSEIDLLIDWLTSRVTLESQCICVPLSFLTYCNKLPLVSSLIPVRSRYFPDTSNLRPSLREIKFHSPQKELEKLCKICGFDGSGYS
jgi:hypothetical protein